MSKKTVQEGDIELQISCNACDLPVMLIERKPKQHETVEREAECICPDCGTVICKAWTATEIKILMLH